MSEKKNKGGRPLKIIDEEKFARAISTLKHKTDISRVVGVDEETLHKWCLKNKNMSFSQYLEQKKAEKKLRIAEYQENLAKTNPTVAIWLGKQELGQTDNPNDKNDMGLLPSLMGVIERVANRNTN